MKAIELQFSVSLLNGIKTFDLSLPFDNGLVYGGEFCPYHFQQEPNERPLHWYRAEEFVAICDNQVGILPQIERTATSQHNLLANVVMEVVRNRINNIGFITLNGLLSELDCYSLLRIAESNHDSKTIQSEYDSVLRCLIEYLPMKIVSGNPAESINPGSLFSWLDSEK